LSYGRNQLIINDLYRPLMDDFLVAATVMCYGKFMANEESASN